MKLNFVKKGGCLKSGKTVIARAVSPKQSIDKKYYGLATPSFGCFARNDGKLTF
jgi:hypothetical protein